MVRKLDATEPAELKHSLKCLCHILKIDELKVLSACNNFGTTLGQRFFDVLLQTHPNMAISTLASALTNEGRRDLVLVFNNGVAEQSLCMDENQMISQPESRGPYQEIQDPENDSG